MVDAASTEGRDPVADIKAINEELRAYNPELLKRPQVIAANKIDAIYTDDETENPVDVIKKAFEPEGIKVYPISAVTGQGLKELLYYVRELLDSMTDEPVMFEKELDTDTLFDNPNEAFYVEKMIKAFMLYQAQESTECLDILILNLRKALISSRSSFVRQVF